MCLSVSCRFVCLFYVGLQDAILSLFWFCLSVSCRFVRCCSSGLVVLSLLVFRAGSLETLFFCPDVFDVSALLF